jgi:uncharacterized protein YwqG
MTISVKRTKKALSPWLDKYSRNAWRPIISSTQDGDSYFGGVPTFSSSNEWPICKNCHHPMQFLLQLNLESLPEKFNAAVRNGIIQLFVCDYYPNPNEKWDPVYNPMPSCCKTWEPFSGTHEIRFFSSKVSIRCSDEVQALHTKIIIGWEEMYDFPHYEEHENFGMFCDYNFDDKQVTVDCPELNIYLEDIDLDVFSSILVTHEGDKLGGWPYWVQSPEYPDCPECKSQMELLIQIDSEHNLSYLFGDAGCAHLTQCRNHPHILAFGWACH